MARYELRYAGTPDTQRRNPFTGQSQTFPGRPGWVKSLVVTRDGDVVFLRAGKEPKTRVTSRRFPGADQARDFVSKLVTTFVQAGYAHVSDEDVDASALPREDDPLLARMAAGDEDAFVVYADKLLERGDPRGELIALLARPSSDDRAHAGLSELLAKHPDVLAGPLAGRLSENVATWRLGFLDTLRIAYDPAIDRDDFDAAELVTAVLAHPSSRLLRSLTVGLPGSGEVSYDDVIVAVAAGAPGTLRRLFIGDFAYPDETEMSWANVGDASMLWLALPALEDVTFQGAHVTLGALHAPMLRSLTIRTGGLGKEPVRAIANGALPNLEHLELWLGDENYGGEIDVSDLAPILDGGSLPALTRLGLCNAEITDELCRALVESRILSRLRALDLSKGTLSDDGARILLAARAKLAHLDVLDVSESCLSSEMCTALSSICKDVRIDDQKGPNNRYVSVSE